MSEWWRQRVRVTLTILLLYAIYFPSSHFTVTLQSHNPAIALDYATPLVPVWILIYGTILPVALLPIFVIGDRGVFRQAGRAYVATLATAFVVFVTYPVHMELRPTDVPADTLFEWAVGFCYWVDQPSNCLPSLHVALAMLGALCCWKADRWVGGVALILALLIAPSTMFVRQHYVADVVAGMILGCGTYALFVARHPLAYPEDGAALPRTFPLLIAAAFGLLVVGLYALYKSGWAPWLAG